MGQGHKAATLLLRHHAALIRDGFIPCLLSSIFDPMHILDFHHSTDHRLAFSLQGHKLWESRSKLSRASSVNELLNLSSLLQLLATCAGIS